MKCKRIAIAALAFILICLAAGGTLAWLTDRSDPVVNTFTAGNIEITLQETAFDFKMVPGNDIVKDPVVTVEGGSEACWLFIRVEESVSPALEDYIAYEMAAGWQPLAGADGVYWLQVGSEATAQSFHVLMDDRVKVLESVTKEMMKALKGTESPSLSFTAYAIQQDTDDCYACGIPAHTHSSGCCGKEEHTHSRWRCDYHWENGSRVWDCGKEAHTHGDGSCNHENCAYNGDEHAHNTETCGLTCGLTGHTHTDACSLTGQVDGSLYTFEHADTVTVGADGTTVMNVYYRRTQFTLTFRETGWNGKTFGTVTAKWGANIESRFFGICTSAGGNFWSEKQGGDSPWTNYIGVMPTASRTYYLYKTDSTTSHTATYFFEDLNGNDIKNFDITVHYGGGLTVTAEDFYEFEGFSFNENRSTRTGASFDGAEFYYDRNTYQVDFYSGMQLIKSEQLKYQANMGRLDFVPSSPPASLEPDAVFAGWYLNPECTGAEYILSVHTMPAANVLLYAKWVNRSYTVSTWTDEAFEDLYRYDGYTGQQNVEKYKLAAEPEAPRREGLHFVGWFYEDSGVENPFLFTMPVTRNYDLYPKWSDEVYVSYTVHYYLEGTTKRVADDTNESSRIGSTVTVKAKMGDELYPSAAGIHYFPLVTSTSAVLTENGMKIIMYYKAAETVTYTIRYVDESGKELIDTKTKTTSAAVVTELYVPIDGYTPVHFQQTLDMSADEDKNVIVFVYHPSRTTLTIVKSGAEDIDENQTFLFEIKGEGVELTVSIHGNGSVTVTDLPVGTYTVMEKTDWSWRYEPDKAVKEIKAEAHDGNTVAFHNVRSQTIWLDGAHWINNIFGPLPLKETAGENY